MIPAAIDPKCHRHNELFAFMRRSRMHERCLSSGVFSAITLRHRQGRMNREDPHGSDTRDFMIC
jgi:hypothetical protein